MNVKANLYYSKDHEWAEFNGDVATVGISDHAQGQLAELSCPSDRHAVLCKCRRHRGVDHFSTGVARGALEAEYEG